MPQIFGQRFLHRSSPDRREPDFEYELALDFKEAAIMKDQLEIEVIGKRRPIGESKWEQVSLILRYDAPGQSILVLAGEKELGCCGLEKYIEMARGPIESGLQELGEAAGGLLGETLSYSFEEMISGISVPDPVLGCLLKGAVSTVVGQTIRCYNGAKKKEHPIRSTLRCLLEYSPRMGLVATGRALRCAMTFGTA